MIKPIPQPKLYPVVKNLPELDAEAPIQSMMRLANEYGGVYKMQLGEETVIILSDPDLVNEVCDESRFDKKVHKPLHKLRDIGGDGLFTAYTHESNWEKAHRILVPAFGPGAIKTMFPQMLDVAQQLVQKWERMGTQTLFDVPDNMTRLTLDTIALCAFDYRFNSFYSIEMHPFVDAMVNTLHEASLHVRRLPIVNKLKVITKREYEREIELLTYVAADIIKDRRTLAPNQWPKDLLTQMLTGKDPVTGESLDDANITNQMITFLIAGHETTSGLLSFAIYLLLKNPDKLQKAQEQVDQVLGNETPSFEQLKQLDYIDQVLKESLRLWPTAPLFGLYPYENTIIGNTYEIRKEHSVLVLLPSLHRSDKIWEGDVEAFKPERFESDNFNKLPPNAYKPFGNGQRACIGRPFAMQEATLVLSMILQNFELSQADPNYQLKVKETLTLKPDRFFIKAKKRVAKAATVNHTPAEGTEKAEQPAGKAFVPPHHTQLLVLFGSNSGTCQDFAYRISTDATEQGYDARIASLDSFSANLPTSGAVIIVTASYEGLPPDNARKFVAWLKTEQADDSLQGLQYAVFGCGNTDWARTYQAVPTYIDNRLNELGATRVLPRGEADAKNDLFGDFDRWYEQFWPGLAAHFSLEVNEQSDINKYRVELATDVPAAMLNEKEMKQGVIVANEELVDISAPNARSKKHIEIALPEGMGYRAGDYLAILPLNAKEKVDELLKRFHFDYHTQVIIHTENAHTHLPKGYPVAVGELLSQYVELNQVVTRKQIRKLVDYTICPPEKIRLEQYAADDIYKSEVLEKRLSLAAILHLNPACELPFEVLLEMLPAMKTRRYSISSSPLWNKRHCTITVAVVDAPALSGMGNYRGTASHYLSALKVGANVTVQVRKSPEAFHLPQELNTPVIMIAAGSGIAPFRGFIQERAIERANRKIIGEMLLFFGCRSENVDFLYKEQLQNWEKEGIVSVHPAFSTGSDNDIAYVQHSLWKHREEVKRLFENGAKIYLCGDGRYMAPAVRETLVKIYQEITGLDLEASSKLWEEQVENKDRFVADIFE